MGFRREYALFGANGEVQLACQFGRPIAVPPAGFEPATKIRKEPHQTQRWRLMWAHLVTVLSSPIQTVNRMPPEPHASPECSSCCENPDRGLDVLPKAEARPVQFESI